MRSEKRSGTSVKERGTRNSSCHPSDQQGDRKIEDSHLILFESASRKIKSEEESRIQIKFERCRVCRLLDAFEQCIAMQCMFALSTNAKMHIFINGFSSTNSVRMSYQSENLFYTYLVYNAKLVEINLNENLLITYKGFVNKKGPVLVILLPG